MLIPRVPSRGRHAPAVIPRQKGPPTHRAANSPRGMAGSGSRPLTNIPYCCLPQESGPCLSASVGDRPPRSPSHRRLGGPPPRRLSNGTHARPGPLSPSSPADAGRTQHPVSPRVSAGCPDAPGWLRTRYAPVRHCPNPTPCGARPGRQTCMY